MGSAKEDAMRFTLTITLLTLLAAEPAAMADVEYVDAKPLQDVVTTKARPVSTSGRVQLPLITWGGDVATIHAVEKGFLRDAGIDVELVLENNFPKQVEAVLSGRTPYLRGTMGMIQAAAETFQREGLEMVVVYQLTWSTGGDAMVVRSGVKSPKDLKGETIALQLYGPHMDYVANILSSAQVPLSGVKFNWLKELTLPTYDTGGKVVDPVNAFLEDSKNDAVMCIIPDALNLTSGGDGGTGAAGSVKGARILLSTKTASRVIADVYAVRGDYLKSNRGEVQKLVQALLKGQEDFVELFADKAARRSEFQQVMTKAADLLLGSPQATPDVEALLGDCEFVGHPGNLAFFTGKGTTRNLDTLSKEIRGAFSQMGLAKSQVALKSADWDYGQLGQGLKNAAAVTATASAKPAAPPRFDPQKVAARVEQKIAVEPATWAEEGTLFQIEINFDPNQSDFTESQYAADFQKALEISQTYGGSLIVIEGHSDPLGILKARQANEDKVVVNQMEQQAKNLSLDRARAVRGSFLDFCKKHKFVVDESQFLAVGLGITTPKFNPPRTKDEWEANRRVVFRIKQIEAELNEFTPLN
jgi:ABC-type nitrate/sulfonate/bicarbonate transport system substrate-binding protein/outer membrane protein OmpA-like peptidoglycan-associated protein